MTICIFGNTNNYPYVLALGFRKIGIPVKLIVNRPELLHRPEGKDPHLVSRYPDWIMDCSQLPEEDFVSESPRLCNVVNALAFSKGAILNHIGPSLSEHLRGPHMALLTGSDLTYYADFRTAETRRAQWSRDFAMSPGGRLGERKWIEFIARQRDGILASNAVSFAPPGLVPAGDELLRAIGVGPERRCFIWLADTISLLPCPHPADRNKLIVLNGARLTWVKPLPESFCSQDNKGTDVLLRGFAQFLKTGASAELRLVRKGLHVKETEVLVQALRIEDSVTWLDELSLADFHKEICNADLVCDQLGESFPGMAALDAMALGRPVIANFHPKILGEQFPERLPVCHADTAEAVCEQLQALAASPTVRRELGWNARGFAERHLSPEVSARSCLERLEKSI